MLTRFKTSLNAQWKTGELIFLNLWWHSICWSHSVSSCITTFSTHLSSDDTRVAKSTEVSLSLMIPVTSISVTSVGIMLHSIKYPVTTDTGMLILRRWSALPLPLSCAAHCFCLRSSSLLQQRGPGSIIIKTNQFRLVVVTRQASTFLMSTF